MTPEQFKTLMPFDRITFGLENFSGEIAEQVPGEYMTFRVILDDGAGEALLSIQDCGTTDFNGAPTRALVGEPLP